MRQLKQEYLEEYFVHMQREEKSRATMDKYKRDVKAFYLYFGNDSVISKEKVIEYKEFLKKRYEMVSVNSILAALNSFFHFLGWQECKVKYIKVQKRSFCMEERELSQGEYKRLLEAAREKKNQQLFYIMQTICATGIRVSELEYITVEGVRKGKIEVYSKGKCRRIFIPSKLRKELLKYVLENGKKRGSVFTTRNGKAVNRSNIWTGMKKLCEAANVRKEKVFPHNLRHLFACTYYNLKKDLVKLADLLGHSSIETTRIYTVSTGREHERQINELGLVMT